ncbi:HK97 family phage major capsid protein [Nitrobacteraceae bacterium AZCC 2161]
MKHVSKATMTRSQAIGQIADGLRAIREVADDSQMASQFRSVAAPKFKSLAENVTAIVQAERGGAADPRLVRAPAGASIGDPTGGGFLVEEAWSQELIGLAYEESLVAALCDRRPSASQLSAIKIPGIDETSRADGSRFGGILSYWGGEGGAPPASLPKFKNLEMSAKKLIALVYGTNELMADAPLFDAHLRRAIKAEFGFKLDLAVLAGTAGQPSGILGSNALITVPKETGQASGTIVRENINKMFKRLPAPSRYSAVWLANEDADEQLEALGGNPGTYIPAGVNGNAFPLLKGRPVITVEQCPTLGTVGDLVLADLSKYVIIDGGMKSAISLHVRFDSDQALLRFAMRVDGKPGFTTPIAPYNGSLTRSPFVTLASR